MSEAAAFLVQLTSAAAAAAGGSFDAPPLLRGGEVACLLSLCHMDLMQCRARVDAFPTAEGAPFPCVSLFSDFFCTPELTRRVAETRSARCLVNLTPLAGFPPSVSPPAPPSPAVASAADAVFALVSRGAGAPVDQSAIVAKLVGRHEYASVREAIARMCTDGRLVRHGFNAPAVGLPGKRPATPRPWTNVAGDGAHDATLKVRTAAYHCLADDMVRQRFLLSVVGRLATQPMTEVR